VQNFKRGAFAAFVIIFSVAEVRAAFMPAEVSQPTTGLAIDPQVAEVGIVAKDLDRSVSFWEKLGSAHHSAEGITGAARHH
jgi:hypothetical protein